MLSAKIGYFGSSSFDPRSLGNLDCWFDFSDASRLAQNSNGTTAVSATGDPVGYVASVVGSYTATQTTSSNRPTFNSSWRNGRSAITVPAIATAGYTMSAYPFTSTTAGAYFFVGLPTASTYMTWWGDASHYIDVAQSGSSLSPNQGVGTPTYRVNGSAVSATRGALYTASYNKPYYLSANSLAVTSAPFPKLFNYGAGFSFYGTAAEILFYGRNLTTGEVASVEAYLAKKWGI